MKKLFYSYPNFILSTLAIVFLATLIGFYLWAVNDTIVQIRGGLIAPPPAPAVGFDLNQAAKLDYRGVMSVPTSTSGN